METPPTSRLTTAIAIAAIVAAVGMLIAGIVLAPSGESEDSEASLVASGPSPHVDDDVAATHDAGASPATTTVHAPHDAADPEVATAAHGHDHVAAEVPGAAAVPAVEEHAHDDAGSAPTEVAPAAAPTTSPTVHDHATPVTAPDTPDAPSTTIPAGPVISVDDPRLTPAQRAAAVSLLDRTRAAMTRFPDEAAVIAAGYVSIGDGNTGFEHYVHLDHLADGAELDAERIESIVLRVAGGTKTVESAMYILTTGSTMADVPEIAGELTTWHDHQNLCWDGIRVVAVTGTDGTCPRGELRPTPPMLHVWLTEQPCGPFSGIEGTHGAACAAHHG